jgi:hypothetical protein
MVKRRRKDDGGGTGSSASASADPDTLPYNSVDAAAALSGSLSYSPHIAHTDSYEMEGVQEQHNEHDLDNGTIPPPPAHFVCRSYL